MVRRGRVGIQSPWLPDAMRLGLGLSLPHVAPFTTLELHTASCAEVGR